MLEARTLLRLDLRLLKANHVVLLRLGFAPEFPRFLGLFLDDFGHFFASNDIGVEDRLELLLVENVLRPQREERGNVRVGYIEFALHGLKRGDTRVAFEEHGHQQRSVKPFLVLLELAGANLPPDIALDVLSVVA